MKKKNKKIDIKENKKIDKKENKKIGIKENKKIDIKEKNVQPSNIIESYGACYLDNIFTVFTSVKDDIIYLIYTNKDNSIISYNLIINQRMNEIKNAHEDKITNLRYFYDTYNVRDLVISLCGSNNSIKVWNINNLDCLLCIKKINKRGFLRSAYILLDNENKYIITSNDNYNLFEDPIKVFDFNEKLIKTIDGSKERILFIDVYYDDKEYKNYILTGNYGYIKSYDYNNNKLYQKYCDNDNYEHNCIIINNNKKQIELIESSNDGNIRIWDFHLNILLKKIKVFESYLYGICLSDEDYLYVGCKDKIIRLIELKTGKIIKELKGHDNIVVTVKIINHSKNGKFLISQAFGEDHIKIWRKEINEK